MCRFGVEPSQYVWIGVSIPHADFFSSLLVLAHNHPNGVVSPTDHDKALTRPSCRRRKLSASAY